MKNQEFIPFSFDTQLTGQNACSSFYRALYGSQDEFLLDFLKPGLQQLSSEFGLQEITKDQIKFDIFKVKDIQEIFDARLRLKNEDEFRNWLRQRYPGEAVTIMGISDMYLDQNGNPILSLTIYPKHKDELLPGDATLPHLLLGTGSNEHAYFDVSLTYNLKFDAPFFHHDVAMTILGYAGSKKLLAENLHSTPIREAGLKQWEKDISTKITSDYTNNLDVVRFREMLKAQVGSSTTGAFQSSIDAHRTSINAYVSQCEKDSKWKDH